MANEKHQIDVELEEAVAQGTYANLAIISHSTSEFVLDFAAVLPGVPKAKVKSRIILAPEHAKRLLLSLQENIARYEANVGRINIPQGVQWPLSTLCVQILTPLFTGRNPLPRFIIRCRKSWFV